MMPTERPLWSFSLSVYRRSGARTQRKARSARQAASALCAALGFHGDERLEERLAQLRDLPSETLDGHRVIVSGNIELPEDVPGLLHVGAEGVEGLHDRPVVVRVRGADPELQIERRRREPAAELVRTDGRNLVIRAVGRDPDPGAPGGARRLGPAAPAV